MSQPDINYETTQQTINQRTCQIDPYIFPINSTNLIWILTPPSLSWKRTEQRLFSKVPASQGVSTPRLNLQPFSVCFREHSTHLVQPSILYIFVGEQSHRHIESTFPAVDAVLQGREFGQQTLPKLWSARDCKEHTLPSKYRSFQLL